MILFLTALDEKANWREFTCDLGSLENKFDFLSKIVARGTTLLTAYILDDNQRTDLPLAAFDGIPLSTGISALQEEWQAILSQPRWPSRLPDEELIRIAQQRIDYYQEVIATHQQMVGWLETWLQRTRNQNLEGAVQLRLLQCYESQIINRQTQLVKAHFQVALSTTRLTQLQA